MTKSEAGFEGEKKKAYTYTTSLVALLFSPLLLLFLSQKLNDNNYSYYYYCYQHGKLPPITTSKQGYAMKRKDSKRNTTIHSHVSTTLGPALSSLLLSRQKKRQKGGMELEEEEL